MSDERNHFPMAAAVERLVEIANAHDKKEFVSATHLIDMSPTMILRGISFLSECLEVYDDAPPMQARIARSTIQEVTALCAVLLDAQVMADSYKMAERESQQ